MPNGEQLSSLDNPLISFDVRLLRSKIHNFSLSQLQPLVELYHFYAVFCETTKPQIL